VSAVRRPAAPRRTPAGIDPPYLYPDYVATRLRSPTHPLVILPRALTELTGPLLGEERVVPRDADLTAQHRDAPIGQRIIVHGRLRDADGRPVRRSLIEIWQANAAGRYAHEADRHPAPLDPNFTGVGRCISDDEGAYRFVTIRPGAYPWQNHANAWRPAHIHFSMFGVSFEQRLVTQMYFPGDPLFDQDPIFNSVPDPDARARMIATYDAGHTLPEFALAFRFDLVLAGRLAPPFEREADDA